MASHVQPPRHAPRRPLDADAERRRLPRVPPDRRAGGCTCGCASSAATSAAATARPTGTPRPTSPRPAPDRAQLRAGRGVVLVLRRPARLRPRRPRRTQSPLTPGVSAVTSAAPTTATIRRSTSSRTRVETGGSASTWTTVASSSSSWTSRATSAVGRSGVTASSSSSSSSARTLGQLARVEDRRERPDGASAAGRPDRTEAEVPTRRGDRPVDRPSWSVGPRPMSADLAARAVVGPRPGHGHAEPARVERRPGRRSLRAHVDDRSSRPTTAAARCRRRCGPSRRPGAARPGRSCRGRSRRGTPWDR